MAICSGVVFEGMNADGYDCRAGYNRSGSKGKADKSYYHGLPALSLKRGLV